MSVMRVTRLVPIAFGLLLAGSVKANEIVVDVSGNSDFPWGGVSGTIFAVGNQFNSTDVRFQSTYGSYNGPTYTSVSTGMFFSVLGWTNVFTLLAQDASPITGAYLAITVGPTQNVSYSYSFNPGDFWNWSTNGFSAGSPTTWTDVANFLFPPPAPPPPPAVVSGPVFTPPPVVTGPTPGLNLSGPAIDADNPEPATIFLFASGLVAFWLYRKRYLSSGQRPGK